MDTIKLEPIGYVKTKQKYKYESPRQSTLAENEGYIKLNSGNNFEQALVDLDGFNRIWVIYGFHLNEGWKPKVNPPRNQTGRKIGMFATRSPYRPNPIGMSCVEIIKVEGLKVYIKNFDMLDGTPVYDIKPYLSYSDSFPDSKTGWLPDKDEEFQIVYTSRAEKEIIWLNKNSGLDFSGFINTQLSLEPTNSKKKRVTKLEGDIYVLSYRTWRIEFLYNNENKIVEIQRIFSGYSSDELKDIEHDKYNDKQIHSEFKLNLNSI